MVVEVVVVVVVAMVIVVIVVIVGGGGGDSGGCACVEVVGGSGVHTRGEKHMKGGGNIQLAPRRLVRHNT